MSKRLRDKCNRLLLAGLVYVTLFIALPTYCVNEIAWDSLNRSRDVLIKQLDSIRKTKGDLIERREQVLNEFQKRIDTLSEYEDETNGALRNLEQAMK